MPGIKDATAVVGIGQTAFAKQLPESEKTLACRAILAALDDAGIAPAEVDALASYTMEETDEVEVAKSVGLGDLTFFSKVGYGGGGSCATVAHLAAAVAAGQATVGVAWRSRKRGSGPRPWRNTAVQLPTPAQWTRPFGLLRPVDEIAMLARRYMHEYGATRDHLANVALAARKHANRNPAAMMHAKPMTRDDYMAARWISEPLCLFDNCLETDGAAAVIVAEASLARKCKQKPAWIMAASQGMGPRNFTMNNYFKDPFLESPGAHAAKDLWEMSGVDPKDVDVAQLYDAFSTLVLASLEEYGFCKPGEAEAFVENGGLEVGGNLPNNTSGGSLSEAYVHGINLIIEAVRQIRGTSCNQVPGASLSLATSGNMVPTGALLLRGE